MKIKIKVKNIILLSLATLFVVLILIPFGTLEIGKYLDRKGSDKSQVFYESYLSKAIKLNEMEAAFLYTQNLTDATDKYRIMMKGSGGSGSPNSLEDIMMAKEALKKVLNSTPKDNNDKKYYILSYSKLMDLSISTQEPEELLDWIQWGEKSEVSEVRYISTLYNAFYHYVNRDYDMAEEILSNNIKEEQIDYKFYLLKGDIALFKGEYEKAKEYYENANEIGLNPGEALFGSMSFVNRLYWLNEYEDNLKGNFKIKGKVTFNGKPMPFVEVYMQDYRNNGFSTQGGDPVAITDINGEYETIGFKSNRYDIGIGLSNSLLYDKVFLQRDQSFIEVNKDINYDFEFGSPLNIISPKSGTVIKGNKFTVEWEQVDGADYYDVQTIQVVEGGSYRYSIMDNSPGDKLKDTKVEFDLNKLEKRVGGISYSGEDMIVSPSGILGNFIPEKEYPIVVNAYDSEKNLIGSSLTVNSYYEDMASLKIEGNLTEGEKLIQNMKYEEAIEHYTNILINDPSNEEALTYLTKIYMLGWKKDAEDYDKAMEYAIRYNEIYDDDSLIYNVIIFMDHDAQRKYKVIIGDLIIDNNEYTDNYEIARFYLSLRDYGKAREFYEKLDYKYTDLLYLDLYLGDFDKALERTNDENLDFYRMDYKIMNESLKNLSKEDIESQDYNNLKIVIDKILSENLSHEEGLELYNSIYSKISNIYIKNILKEIKLEMNWDRDY